MRENGNFEGRGEGDLLSRRELGKRLDLGPHAEEEKTTASLRLCVRKNRLWKSRNLLHLSRGLRDFPRRGRGSGVAPSGDLLADHFRVGAFDGDEEDEGGLGAAEGLVPFAVLPKLFRRVVKGGPSPAPVADLAAITNRCS